MVRYVQQAVSDELAIVPSAPYIEEVPDNEEEYSVEAWPTTQAQTQNGQDIGSRPQEYHSMDLNTLMFLNLLFLSLFYFIVFMVAVVIF